jgi:glycine cleavage system H protein
MVSLIDSMPEIREDLLYTKTHEWILVKNGTARIGITDYAQEHMTDVVFVELPAMGTSFSKGDEMAIIESVKSIAEIYAPLAGNISRINESLENSPELVNDSPYDEGWLVEIEIAHSSELKDLLTYEQYIKIVKD